MSDYRVEHIGARVPVGNRMGTDESVLHEMIEAGWAANSELCQQLDGMFRRTSIGGAPPDVVPELAGYSVRLTHTVLHDERLIDVPSFRVTDGLTTYLTGGKPSGRHAIVRAKRGAPNTYHIMYVRGWKDDDGSAMVAAEHKFGEWEVTSSDDLLRTLTIMDLDPTKEDSILGETNLAARLLRAGELSSGVLSATRLAGSPQVQELVQNGTAMAREATRALQYIGKWVRVRKALGFLAGFV